MAAPVAGTFLRNLCSYCGRVVAVNIRLPGQRSKTGRFWKALLPA